MSSKLFCNFNRRNRGLLLWCSFSFSKYSKFLIVCPSVWNFGVSHEIGVDNRSTYPPTWYSPPPRDQAGRQAGRHAKQADRLARHPVWLGSSRIHACLFVQLLRAYYRRWGFSARLTIKYLWVVKSVSPSSVFQPYARCVKRPRRISSSSSSGGFLYLSVSKCRLPNQPTNHSSIPIVLTVFPNISIVVSSSSIHLLLICLV